MTIKLREIGVGGLTTTHLITGVQHPVNALNLVRTQSVGGTGRLKRERYISRQLAVSHSSVCTSQQPHTDLAGAHIKHNSKHPKTTRTSPAVSRFIQPPQSQRQRTCSAGGNGVFHDRLRFLQRGAPVAHILLQHTPHSPSRQQRDTAQLSKRSETQVATHRSWDFVELVESGKCLLQRLRVVLQPGSTQRHAMTRNTTTP